MKIEFAPRTIRIVRITIVLITVALVAYAAYATATLTISNTSSVGLPPTNLFAITTGVTAATLCTTASGYADQFLSIAWAPVLQGGSTSVNICLKNTGTETDTLSFTNSPLPTGVTLANTAPATLASGAFANIQLTLAASSTATSGAFSFSITIT